MFQAEAVEVVGSDGAVTGVWCSPTEPTGVDADGRKSFTQIENGAKVFLPADFVFVAYGYKAPQPPASDDFARLDRNERGYLKLDWNRMTNLPGVFAGGSIVRGPVHLVQVVQDARDAASRIAKYLSQPGATA